MNREKKLEELLALVAKMRALQRTTPPIHARRRDTERRVDLIVKKLLSLQNKNKQIIKPSMMKTKCILVKLESYRRISDKAYACSDWNGNEAVIPAEAKKNIVRLSFKIIQ